jgi:hypothetical protein
MLQGLTCGPHSTKRAAKEAVAAAALGHLVQLGREALREVAVRERGLATGSIGVSKGSRGEVAGGRGDGG